ncbi:mannose-specific lectin 1-like [Phoenix dactylifera]|uniref:Mannose-specific lectin 1-like n=1 Tax=Phoenix dactylifera TaxID=42345 RepID=A0A8B7CFQ3_PHODC|nr:mannose-specific lectin 1-like [Phoenix dactylifera]
MAGNVLYSESGGKLLSGESLTYRQYSLVMQKDCNLVVYDGNEPIWASGTYGKGSNCFLTLESNGELIIHGYPLFIPVSSPIWTSGSTSVDGSYVLVLEYDGGLRVYGPVIWSIPSQSAELRSDGYGWPAVNDSVLWTGDVAPIGTTIVNSVYKLALEDNCNLTLSDTSTKRVLWYTNTSNNLRDCFVTLGATGEFSIKYMGGETLWSSGVQPQYGEYVLVLSPDADLDVYGPSIWTAEKSAVVAVAATAGDSVPSGEKIVMVSKE